MKRSCQSLAQGSDAAGHCFVIVNTAHENGIHLDRKQARLLRRFDSGDHIVESIAVSHLLESLRVERVQTDVNPLNPASARSLASFRQPQTIGCQGDLRSMRKSVEASHHIHYVRTK